MAIKINGEIVQFIHSLAPGGDSETVIEIDNQEDRSADVELRLTNVNETDPAGRFRLRTVDDTVLFERATSANWETADVLLTLNEDGTAVEWSEQSIVDLFEHLQYQIVLGGPLGLRFVELVQLAILGE